MSKRQNNDSRPSSEAKVARRDDMFPDDPVEDDEHFSTTDNRHDEPFYDQDTESIASHSGTTSTAAPFAASKLAPINSFSSLLGSLICKPTSNGEGEPRTLGNTGDAEGLRNLNSQLAEVVSRDVDEDVVSSIDSMLKEELPLNLPARKSLNLWKLLTALRSPANILDESDPNYQVTCDAYKAMMDAYNKVESKLEMEQPIPEEADILLHVTAAKFFKCLLVSNTDMQPKHLRPIVSGRNFIFFDTQSKNLLHLLKTSLQFSVNEAYSRYEFTDRKNAIFKLEGWGVVAVRPKPSDRKYTEVHPDCTVYMAEIFRSLCAQRIPELVQKKMLSDEVFFNVVVRKNTPTIQGFDNNKLKTIDKDLQLAHVTINDAYLLPSKSKREPKVILVVVLYVNYFLTMRGNM